MSGYSDPSEKHKLQGKILENSDQAEGDQSVAQVLETVDGRTIFMDEFQHLTAEDYEKLAKYFQGKADETELMDADFFVTAIQFTCPHCQESLKLNSYGFTYRPGTNVPDVLVCTACKRKSKVPQKVKEMNEKS